MYKKAYTGNKLKHLGPNWVEIHLWEEDKGHQIVPYNNIAYQECTEEEQTRIIVLRIPQIYIFTI